MTETQSFGPFPWKDYPSVRFVEPVSLLVCSSCGEIGMRPADSDRIDQAVQESIRKYINVFINAILVREECSQVELAGHLGVTPEYLSYMKAGTKIPSFQTFNFLKVMAFSHQTYMAAEPEMDTKQIEAFKELSA
jgi:hypothetical protein